MIDQHLVLLGAAVNLMGALIYTVETVRGDTRPNRATWGLWAAAALITFAAQVGQGVGLTAALTLAGGVGPLIVFISSFVNPKSYWRLGSFDWACVALSLLALLLWWISGSGILAIVLALLADLAAALPTFIKAYRFPGTESAWAYATGWLGALIALLATQQLTFAALAFSVYIVVGASFLSLACMTNWRPLGSVQTAPANR